jgi:hypothetical protein
MVVIVSLLAKIEPDKKFISFKIERNAVTRVARSFKPKD